jgi:hypothetical protein
MPKSDYKRKKRHGRKTAFRVDSYFEPNFSAGSKINYQKAMVQLDAFD